jgi:threonyl-tRNA synthetase
MNDDSRLFRIRHSLAHVLAQAMQRYRPGTVLGFGPAIEDGFFYDFILPEPIGEEDLPAIQALMEEIVAERQEFSYEDLPIAAALERLRSMGEPHKEEYAHELVAKQGLEQLRFYTNGRFVDVCEGPHVESTKDIPKACFQLHAVAGAYWRGDEKREMMTRVYGWAFEDRKTLKVYEQARKEALERDHRKLGKELDLFTIEDVVGKGLPLWLPHGATIIEELEKLAKEWEFQAGYERVRTPSLTRGWLYQISGHLELYKEGMWPGMPVDDDESGDDASNFFLRPMNCPHHHMVFASRPRSYRDLPLRLSEYGTCYRYERSGTLHGLTRVRSMCMNDAHIYVTRDQIKDEFLRVMELHRRYYDLFGFASDTYHMRLSRWDPDDPKGREKYVNDPEAWEFCERIVRAAMVESGLPFVEAKGEAAFYGPKIDMQFKTVGLKEFTLSTNQLDFAVPKRFRDAGIPVVYTDHEGHEQLPYVLHRAPLSTHERFVSFLIEHYGGAFPTWLAPVQVRLLPVSEKYLEYAEGVCAALRAKFVRAEVDTSPDKLGKKIRTGAVRKIPVLLIIGEQEQEQGTVTVRRYKIDEQRSMASAAFEAQILAEIGLRRHVRGWDDVVGDAR